LHKIKFVIKSDLDNVSLVSRSVKNLCLLTPFTANQTFQVELCAVEAMNNSIIHAYKGAAIHEVTVLLSFNKEYLMLEVIDKGKPMNNEVLDKACLAHSDKQIENAETFSESGRGLGVIKEYMDKVSYHSNKDGNRLKMIKYF
jgi:serine/threonine-protein kinase RsbW